MVCQGRAITCESDTIELNGLAGDHLPLNESRPKEPGSVSLGDELFRLRSTSGRIRPVEYYRLLARLLDGTQQGGAETAALLTYTRRIGACLMTNSGLLARTFS